MTQESALTSSPIADPAQLLATFAETPLTSEQLERLRWCANGNTLRFEASTIVEALIAGGYAKQGYGRVVTLTPKGQSYLGMQGPTTVSSLEHNDGQAFQQRIQPSPHT